MAALIQLSGGHKFIWRFLNWSSSGYKAHLVLCGLMVKIAAPSWSFKWMKAQRLNSKYLARVPHYRLSYGSLMSVIFLFFSRMEQSTVWRQSGCSRSTPTTRKQLDIVICIVLILGVQTASYSTGGYWCCFYLIKKDIYHDDYILNLKGIKRPICKKAFHPNSPFVIIALVAGGTLNCKKKKKKQKIKSTLVISKAKTTISHFRNDSSTTKVW